jgi:hypothetical protein
METHIFIIRHFETDNNEKINYQNSIKEVVSFIKVINEYIKKFNINEIDIITSPQDRTLITGLILSNYLKDINNIKVNSPTIDNIIDRDPKKKRREEIKHHFKHTKSIYKNKTIIIYVTHSSVYYTIFESILKNIGVKTINESNKIHKYSLSYINKNNKNVEYLFNLNLRKNVH